MNVSELNLYHKEQKNPDGKRWNCDKCLIKSPGKIFTNNDIMGKLIQMESQYAELLKKYENQVKINEDLVTEIGTLKSRLDEVELVVRSSPQNAKSNQNQDLDSLFSEELFERQKRSNNVILFNMPEKGQDMEDIKNLFYNTLKETVTVSGVTRIGKPNRNKNRAVKVSLLNNVEVISLISKRSKLKGTNIYLSADLTRRQRETEKAARDELIQRRNNGESNIQLKYVHGVPKVVEKKIEKN